MPLEYDAGQWLLDGEAVTAEQLTELRDAMIDQFADELGQIAIEELGLSSGKSDVRAAVEFPLGRIERFGARFLSRVADAITTAYTVARGGVAAVTDRGWTTIVEKITQQETYAQGFLDALRTGEVSEAQAVARARLYAGSAAEAFSIGMSDQVGLQLPGHPADGKTTCKGSCRCVWLIEELADRWEATWDARDDSGTCKECQERARDWAPYVQRKTAEA